MAAKAHSRRTSAGARSLPPATSGPWKGVKTIDAAPVAYRGGEWLYSMQNLYIPLSDVGAACLSRPSVTRMGTLQLGSGTTRNGQCVFNHVRPDGTEDRLLFAGGKMYRWDGSTSSPVATDITPGAVTISTTARIYCATFGGLLIVSDGVNRPWTYNPATTTATYIDIDGAGTAWTAYGPPVVYGAKLFFIRGSLSGTVSRTRIIWSEEVDPSLGYQQVLTGITYTNFWTLSQTSSDPLVCLVARNDGLWYFRPDSVGVITGQVNSQFATTATHDAISSTIGTLSPGAVLLVDEDIYFLDRSARPHCLRGGREIVELWRARPEVTLSATLSTIAAHATATFLPDLRLVLFDTTNGAMPSSVRQVFSHGSHRSFGSWWLPNLSMRAMGVLRDSTGIPQMVMIGQQDYTSTGVGTAAEGYVYRFRQLGESVTTFDDGMGTSVANRSIGVVLGDDLERDQVFTLVTAEVYKVITGGTYTLSLTAQDGSTGAGTTATATGTATAGGNADRVAFGINAHFRRLLLSITCSDTGNPFFRIGRLIAHRMDGGIAPDGY